MKDMILLIEQFGPIAGLLLYMIWKDAQVKKGSPKPTTPTTAPSKVEVVIRFEEPANADNKQTP